MEELKIIICFLVPQGVFKVHTVITRHTPLYASMEKLQDQTESKDRKANIEKVLERNTEEAAVEVLHPECPVASLFPTCINI